MSKRKLFAGGGLRGQLTTTDGHDHSDRNNGGQLSKSAFGGKHPFTTTVKVIGATGAISSTTVIVLPDPGPYQVSVYVEVTVKSANGTITIIPAWADAVGATSDSTTVTKSVTATGRFYGTLPIEIASGSLTFTSTVTTFTGTYNVRVTAEALR